MNEDERMVQKNWGSLFECPACGEDALQQREDDEPYCLYCGYEEGEDDEQ